MTNKEQDQGQRGAGEDNQSINQLQHKTTGGMNYRHKVGGIEEP